MVTQLDGIILRAYADFRNLLNNGSQVSNLSLAFMLVSDNSLISVSYSPYSAVLAQEINKRLESARQANPDALGIRARVTINRSLYPGREDYKGIGIISLLG